MLNWSCARQKRPARPLVLTETVIVKAESYSVTVPLDMARCRSDAQVSSADACSVPSVWNHLASCGGAELGMASSCV